eukprot:CAMPEP_0179354890 /NCGR_PEP_ID=MMETSP0797-20121207/77085_1 /TAXON_ID=47934 /ORGANISM="Dinophysis acuminata, Strain DAEP01" /LENGTH=533 /DNA_ID=CAMNT_0021070009 /DNA_START=131 /DNA_END=1729 /DNA_ORIENTATION=-
MDLAQGYSLAWSNLTLTVRPGKSDEKAILKGVSGHCRPGQMLALMGPSGSGKTTLLDLLGDRVGHGRLEGKVLIGQHEREAASSRKIVSYVAQEDALLTCFTVRETLHYAARLSLASMSWAKRDEQIMKVMERMGLTTCADTRVGDPLIKGLSGGQKRRLSIAVELLQGSPVLLLDEPTSGLDAAAARHVVQHLRAVANHGHTIVLSIHQPSSAVYGLFDSVNVLAQGRQVYFGPVGREAVEHFKKLGHQCPEYTNPAEFFLGLVNEDFGQTGAAQALADAYPASDTAKDEADVRADKLERADPGAYRGPAAAAGPLRQFAVLLRRILHMSWKNPYIYAVRLVMYVALAFMVGTMYLGVGTTARDDSGPEGHVAANSLLPLLFYVQAFLVFMSVAVLPFFLEQRDVFRRERSNGQITCMPYVFANFLAGLPGIAIIAVISTLLVVLLADLNGFGPFLLNLFLSLVAAESLMHVIGAAQPHYIIGMAFGAGLFGMFMLCEGFMVPFEKIPVGWIWGYRIALHTYSFEWFMHNQF